MWHVGMDVHKRQTTFCILDEYGRKVRTQTVRGGTDVLIKELGKIDKPFDACYEASNGYGHLYDELAKVAARILVAHPGHLRMIFRSKRKNDRVDAEKLGKLLYLGEVPQIHVPRKAVRAWRSMINYRHRLVGTRTGAKCGLRALLRAHGITGPKGLWTKRGMKWLEEIEFDDPFDAIQRDQFVERIDSLNRFLKRVEARLGEIGRANPGVNLLMTIPGVGIRTAEAVMAWVDKPERFHSIKAAGCYFGLVPGQNQSAERNRFGHITKQGPAVVRKLLVEAAWQGRRRSPVIRACFERIVRDDPDRKKIAIVATAHYLVRVMLAMLQTGEVWRHTEE